MHPTTIDDLSTRIATLIEEQDTLATNERTLRRANANLVEERDRAFANAREWERLLTQQRADSEVLRDRLAEALRQGSGDTAWPALIEAAADAGTSDAALRRIAKAQGRIYLHKGWQREVADRTVAPDLILRGAISSFLMCWDTWGQKRPGALNVAVASLRAAIGEPDPADATPADALPPGPATEGEKESVPGRFAFDAADPIKGLAERCRVPDMSRKAG